MYSDLDVADDDGFSLPVRFLHERHEQTKQDLKGLEDTVVSGPLSVSLSEPSSLPLSLPPSPLIRLFSRPICLVLLSVLSTSLFSTFSLFFSFR